MVHDLILPFHVPPPLALVGVTDVLRPPGVSDPRWEAKWDGWRGLWACGRLWSRRGTDLTRYFPDLVPVLAARLPDDVVIDGEIVCWNTGQGRLDFQALSRRLTAGRRLAALAAANPAHLVCFDLLAADGQDLRALPQRDRRARLQGLLSGMGSPIDLCQHTAVEATALEWFRTLKVAGIAGLVIKDAASPYPTGNDQRVWHKLKVRDTRELVCTAVLGNPREPTVLVLSAPTGAGKLRPAGATGRLSRTVARDVGRLLQPTGETELRWPGGPPGTASARPVDASVVRPLIVEVSADVATDNGILRHAARLIRPRPDLSVEDLAGSP